MGIYFLGTSALVKRYIFEPGQAWISSLCNPLQGNGLYLAQVTRVEAVATICRKAREKHITIAERDRLIDTFRLDSQESYNIWPVNNQIYDAAGDLCRTHPLRAYDAVQLACVLALRTFSQLNQVAEPTFISADARLLEIAISEKLKVENPNNYA